MRDDPFTFSAEDGKELFVYRWLPERDAPPRAFLLISHGMGEHAGRYAALARRLTAVGYAVYAPDQRGHGRSAEADALGHLGDRGGWNAAVGDLVSLARRAASEWPGARRGILGHSMGSMLVQQLLIEHGDTVDAAVLSGPSGAAGRAAGLGLWLARLERLRVGRRGESGVLRWLAFGRSNDVFEPARTPFDWLSRDRHEVARYVADPLCGFALRAQGFCELLEAMGRIHAAASLARIPKPLPIYVCCGGEDPLHDGLKRIDRMLAGFEAAGLEDVSRRVYERGRHELLHEVNRDEVCEDLIRWLDDHLAPPQRA